MSRRSVGQRQFLESLIAVFKVDGSDVTTAYANTALDIGAHIGKIKVGEGADDNLYTIKLNKPLGLVPSVFVQPITLNLAVRPETITKQLIPLRCLQASDLSTDAVPDMFVFVFGTEQMREGNY